MFGNVKFISTTFCIKKYCITNKIVYMFILPFLTTFLFCGSINRVDEENDLLKLGTFNGTWELTYRISKYNIEGKIITDTLKPISSTDVFYTFKYDTIFTCNITTSKDTCGFQTFKTNSITMTYNDNGWLSDSIWLNSNKDTLFLYLFSRIGEVRRDTGWVSFTNGETITHLHRKIIK